MQVELIEIKDGGASRRVALFESVEGQIRCDNPTIWKHLMSNSGGVIVGHRGRRYHPSDGDAWLESLRFHYAGPYLFARVIEESRPEGEELAESETLSEVLSVPYDPHWDAGAGRVDGRGHRPVHGLWSTWGVLHLGGVQVWCGELGRVLEDIYGVSLPELRRDGDVRQRLAQVQGRSQPELNAPRLVQYGDRLLEDLLEALSRNQPRRVMAAFVAFHEVVELLDGGLAHWCERRGLPAPQGAELICLRPGELEDSWRGLSWTAGRDHAEPFGFIGHSCGLARDLRSRGAERLQSGDLLGALADLRRAVGFDPANLEGRLAEGEVLRRLEHPQARLELEQVLLLDALRAPLTPPIEVRRALARRRLNLFRALGRLEFISGYFLAGVEYLERAVEEANWLSSHEQPRSGGGPELADLRIELTATLARACEGLRDTARATYHRNRLERFQLSRELRRLE